jgi:hypothetical protein
VDFIFADEPMRSLDAAGWPVLQAACEANGDDAVVALLTGRMPVAPGEMLDKVMWYVVAERRHAFRREREGG